MAQSDAYRLLATEMEPYRRLTHAELREFVGQLSSDRRRGDDGLEYVIEVGVEWYDRSRDEIMVEGMAALASTGPLRRLDRGFISTPTGHRSRPK